jgi:hypothetical protein
MKEIIKEMRIAGKGQNETYEIANPLKTTRIAKSVIQTHVAENREAREAHNFAGDNSNAD